MLLIRQSGGFVHVSSRRCIVLGSSQLDHRGGLGAGDIESNKALRNIGNTGIAVADALQDFVEGVPVLGQIGVPDSPRGGWVVGFRQPVRDVC